MAPTKALILLSSGLDSAASLYWARHQKWQLWTLSINYGQRAYKPESDRSSRLAKKLGATHLEVSLPWLGELGGSSLTNKQMTLPIGDAVDLQSLDKQKQSAASVWVPNRNGVFLEVAGAYADAFKLDYLVTGFNAEEAVTFADNSQAYVDAMQKALRYSCRHPVSVVAPFHGSTKTEIMKTYLELGGNIEDLWSCYESFEQMCGQCESCLRFRRAARELGITQIDQLFKKG